MKNYELSCPVNVGDTVYVPYYPPLKVVRIVFIVSDTGDQVDCDYQLTAGQFGGGGYLLNKDEKDDIWFLTQEEADERKKTWFEGDDYLDESANYL